MSELLTELENTGLVVSQTSSKGRHGYGTQYKLVVSPEMVGKAAFPEWWNGVVKAKVEHEASEKLSDSFGMGFTKRRSNLAKTMNKISQENWKKYVGL